MNIVTYAAFAYFLTVLISLAVITMVVFINKLLMIFSKNEAEGE